jgi:hypothetical protein
MLQRSPLHLALLAAAALPASAQDYWPWERILAERTPLSPVPLGELTEVRPPALPPGTQSYTFNDPRAQMLEESLFLRTLQNPGGGMGEAEHLPTLVQTDNTTESIWVWSRYRELTGDTQFDANTALAWQYVMVNPAYLEEGGSGPNGYYRIYNCGWALIAEPAYRRVTGDTSFLGYANACASYVRSNPLNHNAALNAMTAAWAAGALYDFGVEQGDAAARADAVAIGEQLRLKVEAVPLFLGGEDWALSGGTLMWGILRSTFRERAGARSWAAQYAPLLDTWDPDGVWNHASNAWFQLGRLEAWEATADRRFLNTFRSIHDTLLAADTDDDGGIQAESGTPSTVDQSWVSNYLVFMGMDRVEPGYEVAAAGDAVTIAPGETWRVAFSIANHDALSPLKAWIELELTGPGFGPLLFVGPRGYRLKPGQSLPARQLRIPLPAMGQPGAWRVTIRARDAQGAVIDSAYEEVQRL